MNKFVTAKQSQGWFKIRDVHYVSEEVWSAINEISQEAPRIAGSDLSVWERHNRDIVGDFLVKIAILALLDLFRNKPADARQEEYLADILAHLYIYFLKDPRRRVLKYFPSTPQTLSDKGRFHAHFLTKAKNIFNDLYRKVQVQKQHDEDVETVANIYMGKTLTGLDKDVEVPFEYIISDEYSDYAQNQSWRVFQEIEEIAAWEDEESVEDQFGHAITAALASQGLFEEVFVLDYKEIEQEMRELGTDE